MNVSNDNIKPGLTFETVIERLALGGDVIGRAPDGRVVFCRGAAPGDLVEVRLTDVRKKFCRGEIIRLESGPDSIEPFCAMHDECGGCPWQTVPPSTQLDALSQQVHRGLKNALKREVEVAPCVSFGGRAAWRSAARLHWRNGELGYHRAQSRDVLDIEHCPVLAAPLPDILSAVRKVVLKRIKGSGTVRMVGARDSVSGTVEFRCNADGQVPFVLAEALLKQPCVHGVTVIEADGYRHTTGECVDLLGPQRVPHPTGAFVQAHQRGNEALVERVLNACIDYEGILEFYAGSGNFTIPLTEYGHRVHAVEIDENAVSRLNEELERRGLCALSQAQALSADTVPDGDWDVLILDPPRSGARRIVEQCSGVVPFKRIVYVSCHPASFIRDVAILNNHGWRQVSVEPFDLFPHTGHGEVLGILDRVS